MEQARLSLKQREHTFKLTFSEPSLSLLLKLPNNPTLLHGERNAYFGAEVFQVNTLTGAADWIVVPEVLSSSGAMRSEGRSRAENFNLTSQ